MPFAADRGSSDVVSVEDWSWADIAEMADVKGFGVGTGDGGEARFEVV